MKSFDRPGPPVFFYFYFYFFPLTSSQNIFDLSKTSLTSLHQQLTPKSLRSSLIWCSITVRSVGTMKNARRSTSMPLLQVRKLIIRTNGKKGHFTRFIGLHYLHFQNYRMLRPPNPVRRLQFFRRAAVTFRYFSSSFSVCLQQQKYQNPT